MAITTILRTPKLFIKLFTWLYWIDYSFQVITLQQFQNLLTLQQVNGNDKYVPQASAGTPTVSVQGLPGQFIQVSLFFYIILRIRWKLFSFQNTQMREGELFNLYV